MSSENRFAYVVYTSTATTPFTNQQLFDLLHVAQDVNGKMNITGALIYRNGIFVQMIEGPEAAVNALEKKIYADPRHCGIMTLIRGFSAVRIFGEWTMHFISSDALNAKEHEINYSCLRGDDDIEEMLDISSTYKLDAVENGLHPGLRLLLIFRQIM